MTSQQSEPPNDTSPSSPLIDSELLPDESSDRFPVVGIGASAGGLDAFTQLLNHLSIDTGMAFVLIQHLDPNRKSLLSELLAHATLMPVVEAQDGVTVEPNHVYVNPADSVITLVKGKLCLAPRDKTHKVNKIVDTFFNSLAEDLGEKAIAVVLSGGDADGTQGIETVKAAGGITFAQSSETAQVSSMPNTAIATGQIDFVLPPYEIATELAEISRHSYIRPVTLPTSSEVILEEKESLSTIFNLLRTIFGVDFSNYKSTTIQRRILRRMALYRLETLSDYIRILQDKPAEMQALYQEILIHITSFFRDPGAFVTLKQEVFPAILRDRPAELPIRVWVAGCSTGEEAYSIAICLLEFLAHQPRHPQIQIFATDVSELAIEKARLGIYLPSQVADISPDRLQRFFVPVEGGYQISKTVRELCVFARQNLTSDPPFSHMDLISCRNVLIYFGASLQKKVLPTFHYGLKPTGFLMLGSSETVGEFSNLFHLVDRKHKIYAKQPASLMVSMEPSSITYAIKAISPSNMNDSQPNEISLSEAVDQIVLNQYAPIGVVVNAQLDIVQFRGQTGTYLQPSPGPASLNVLSMVREELRLDLRTAIHQAKQQGQAVRKDGIQLKQGEQISQIQIDVVPIKQSTASDEYFLILFLEMPTLESARHSGLTAASTHEDQSQERAEILRLEQELETTKAYLRSIIEEQQSTNQDLRAANEEILSSNEELQSTNEELQTAKEEIQATNEELSTINDELYRRNAETMQVNNDFQNLLSSINIPILMLEADLRIRRFTPSAATLFNLIPTDIGRPLSDINHKLNINDLEAKILEVTNTLHLINQEVQDQEGHWYDLRIRPYRTLDNRIDGSVVVLVEIDTLKRSTDQLRAARSYADAIAQTVRESILVLNSDLQVVTANKRFYETFHLTRSTTDRICIFDLSNGEWNIPRLRSLLEDLLHTNTEVENFQIKHEFGTIGSKVMQINARKLTINDDEQLIFLAIEDMSDRLS